MPSALGDEELKLKQRARRRLIGATVLVLLLVFLLPLVLEKKPQPIGDKLEIHYPSDTGSASREPVAPAPVVEPKPEAPPPVAAPPPPASTATTVEPATSAPRPAITAPEPSAAPPPTESPPPPSEAAGEPKPSVAKPAAVKEHPAVVTSKPGYYVQVGVFAKSENAKQAQAQLARNNIKARTDLVRSAAGQKTRVRIGPFASRAQAEAMLARVKLAGVHDARVAMEKGG
jgi:DedD protein